MGEEKDAVGGLGGFGTAGRGAGLFRTGGAGGAGGARDPDRIRSDIERTRDEMGETVDEIKERLSREHIKTQVRDATIGRARRMTGDTGRRIKAGYCNAVSASYDAMSRVVRNPLPAVLIPVSLIGTGLAAWGLAGRRGRAYEDIEIDFLPGFEEMEPDLEGAEPLIGGEPAEFGETGERPAERYGRRYRGRAREAVGRASAPAGAVRERAGEVARQARASAEGYARRTRESAGWIGGKMKEKVRQVGTGARRAPGGWSLFLAVAGVAAGMVAGFLLPETQVERRYIGDARQRLKARVRETGREAAATARETAETAAKAARRAVSE